MLFAACSAPFRCFKHTTYPLAKAKVTERRAVGQPMMRQGLTAENTHYCIFGISAPSKARAVVPVRPDAPH